MNKFKKKDLNYPFLVYSLFSVGIIWQRLHNLQHYFFESKVITCYNELRDPVHNFDFKDPFQDY